MPDDSGKGEAAPSGARGEQAEVIAFLSQPQSYPGHPPTPEILETHGAIVFLVGAEAYKIKKSVRFSYMDFSTLDKRRQAIARELEFNRPQAPEIYLDAVAVAREPDGRLALAGAGPPVEWVLRMRRFDQADLLSARADRGPLGDALLRHLADKVIAFHACAVPDRTTDGPGQLLSIADEVCDALEAAAPRIAPWTAGELRRKARVQIEAVRGLLDERARKGLVRRCHGDLHLGNIVLWNGAPVLFDAIEFDERLATIDVLYDLAFLLMDLDHRGQRSGANTVLNRYLWRSQSALDLEALAALPVMLALRAGVRAMVSAQRARQSGGAEADAAGTAGTAYLATALHYLEPCPPVLVVVGGLSGTGKSTLAAALAPGIGLAPGAVHLRSDLERKALFRVEETGRLPEAAYAPDATGRVYAVLQDKAAVALAAGHSVVMDAVYADAKERAAVRALADRCRVPLVGLWLEAPAEVLMARVTARRGDASDATRDVVARQLGYDPGHIDWMRIEAGGDPDATLTAARAQLAADRRTP